MVDWSTIVKRAAGVEYEAEDVIMRGMGFKNLGTDFVVSQTTNNALQSDIGRYVYSCQVIDNNSAVVHCPSVNFSSPQVFQYFATPLSAPRRLIDVTFSSGSSRNIEPDINSETLLKMPSC